ncbi:MAG TPA: hypothetical protein VKT82_22800 [Ktedonobacterales bacterium]|nr:hypothetical protein [Ktedonobacterales bacterium]
MNGNGYRPFPSPGPECASFADALPLLDENTLDAETHAHLRQHIGTCAYCQAQVATDTRIAGVFRRYFEQPAPRLFSPEELMQITDNDKRPADPQQTPPVALKRPRARHAARLRTLTAVAAIAAIVVLFVVLFQGFGLGRNHPQTGSHPTATPSQPMTPTPTPLPNQSYRVPIIAPSNPQIVYQLTPVSASASQLLLQRSTDGGASWHNFSLPAQSNGPLPILFVSPLDAQEVFVSLGGKLVNNTCVPQQTVGSNSTLSTGNQVCALQYFSQDSGAHWTQLHFPLGAILGAFSALNDFGGTAFGSIRTLQAQGTRLYSALVAWVPSPYGSQETLHPKLVASTDDGLTWQSIENGLPDTLCDYAPAPRGSTVFALVTTATAPNGCVGQPLTLWRSDDAGGHWARVGQVPDNVDFGMVVSGTAAQPALYLNTASSSCPPSSYVTLNPASAICNGSPHNLHGSLDGGQTWHAAPTQGYPDPHSNPGVPLGVLSDGSALFLVDNQFYAWKFGAAAWQRVGPAVSGGFQYALVTVDSAGHNILWVVTAQGSGAFTIKSYPL